VDELGRENAVGLRGQELLPGQTSVARCAVNSRSMQNLPHRGGSDRMALLDELAYTRQCPHMGLPTRCG
jgi:hypothetical protein